MTKFRVLTIFILSSLAFSPPASAQTRRTPPRSPTQQTVTPEMTCPSPLGPGVTSKLSYCDVLAGRDPSGGILITLPPHRGPVTLTLDLHNRQTYSEEQVKANRAFSQYTAVIGVLTMDNTLINRAAVQSEFRNTNDLVERIGGGAGPGGLKAVAPTGKQAVTIKIGEAEDQVSILGEKLTVTRPDGSATYSTAGRPIAVISNVRITYTPAPPKRPAARRPAPATPKSP